MSQVKFPPFQMNDLAKNLVWNIYPGYFNYAEFNFGSVLRLNGKKIIIKNFESD